MREALADLIARLSQTMNDPHTRPVRLHWSDVELLKVIQDELNARDETLELTRNALLLALRGLPD